MTDVIQSREEQLAEDAQIEATNYRNRHGCAPRLRVRYERGGWYLPMEYVDRLGEHRVAFGPWRSLDALWFDVRGPGRALS
jgi:hypothetical protein